MSVPACSVIIPSHNRRTTLDMVLDGLARQTLPQTEFEIMVVLDGASGDSAAMLAERQQAQRPTNLHWHQQPHSGQATARNTGVHLAKAPIIVFLDDDIVPEPDLLEVHLRWHRQDTPHAVLGDCQVVRERHDSLYHLGVWAWWEDKFYQRALPGRQPGYRDFCTGNASLRRQDFLRVGGFDAAFRGYGGEDYELGYRLLRAGVRFVADRSARACHYHRTTLEGVLRATRQEAHGDVLLGYKHPELRAGLRLARIPPGRYGLLVRLALRAPVLGDGLMAVVKRWLPLYERAQMRRGWQIWFNFLRGYAYWRGVRDALGSWDALLAYQARVGPLPQTSLEISDGLPAVLPPLWVDGPSTIELTWRGTHLGTLRVPEAIESPLRPYLAEQVFEQLGVQLGLLLCQAERLPWDMRPPVAHPSGAGEDSEPRSP